MWEGVGEGRPGRTRPLDLVGRPTGPEDAVLLRVLPAMTRLYVVRSLWETLREEEGSRSNFGSRGARQTFGRTWTPGFFGLWSEGPSVVQVTPGPFGSEPVL